MGSRTATDGANACILVDPNLVDAGGTTAITVFAPDASGDRLVYGLSRHGSDVQDLFVIDVAGGVALGDRLLWVKFASIAWWRDGFFYTRYPQPGTVPPEHEQYFCQVWFHRLGDLQSADLLIYHRPDAPDVVFDVAVTSDDRHLVITSHRGSSDNAEVHVLALPAADRPAPSAVPDLADPPMTPLVTGFTAGWHFIDGADGQLYFRTDDAAPFGRIVRFDLEDDRSGAARATSWRPTPIVIVPESADTIVDAAISDGRLLVSSLRSASSRLTLWTLDGRELRESVLPGIGTIIGLGAGWHEARAFATFTAFTMPPTILACDTRAGLLTPIARREPAVRPERLRDRTGLVSVKRRHVDFDVPGRAPRRGPGSRQSRWGSDTRLTPI